jgi:WD40 repeat protein
VRLKNWVDDEAEAVQMYTRIAEAAAMHQVGKAGLWRPPDLQLALNWQAKHKPTLVWGQRYNPAFERTMIFLEYSKKEWETEQRIKELEQKRKLQRARMTAIVMGSATIISLIFLIFAFIQKAEADKARAAADEQRILAVENEKVAKKQTEIAEHEKAEAIKARAEAEKQKSEAEKAKEEAVKNEELAKAQKLIADEQRTKAIANEKEAIKNKNLADEQTRQAVIAKNDAEKRRYLAIGKAMAIKSRDIPDAELQALIAQHSYIFNNRYEGYAYDNDVYTALFRALKTQNDPLTRSLQGHDKGACRVLAAHVGSKKIYSGGSDGRILRWTYANDKWSSEELVGPRLNFQVYSIAVSKDGNYLIAGGSAFGDVTNNFVELYDLKNGVSSPKKIIGYVHDIDNLLFTNNDKSFYSRDNAGFSIKLSDLNTASEVVSSKEKINSIALSPDGKFLAGAGNDGTLYLWDIQNNYSVKTLYKNPADNKGKSVGLSAVTFSNDSYRVVVGDVVGQVKLVSLANPASPRVLAGHTSTIEDIVFNHAGTFMATASNDKKVRIWNMDRLQEQPIILDDHSDWVRTAVFTADDEQLLAGINSNTENAKETIHAWPTKMATMAGLLCGYVKRNLTEEEWASYVDKDLTQEKTCANIEEKKN